MAGLAPLAARKANPKAEAKRPTPAKAKPHAQRVHSTALHPPPLGTRPARSLPKLAEGRIQTKLTVSEPDDAFEREADRVADHVMRTPAGASAAPSSGGGADDEKKLQRAALDEQEDTSVQREAMDEEEGVQRACADCDDDVQRAAMDDDDVQRAAMDDEEDVQRACAGCDDDKEHVMRQGDFFSKPPPEPQDDDEKASAVQPKGRRGRAKQRSPSPKFRARLGDERRGGGEPLPTPLRQLMESRFAQGFERVRIHRDAAAADLTSAARARAFTVGRHVFFNQGEFQPHTQQGQHLVAHELTHVLQQRGGMHSVQREVMEREPSTVQKSDEEQRAAEALSFDTIAKLFGWRDDVLPPLVFDTLRSLVTKALGIAAFRESLAVFGLDEPLEEDVRRIVHSPSHELELELEQRGDEAPPDTRWTLDFLDGERVPAKGGAPVTIHTDEDSVSVADTGSTRTVPAETPVEPSTPAKTTTTTAVKQPAAASAATAGAPEAASLETAPTAKPEAAPGAESAAPSVEEAPFPASPEEDPNFQAVVASAEGAANTSSEHGPSGELAANAKDAAAVTPGEQASKAQGQKTDEMQGAKTPGFDKQAFVQAVLDKVRETAPHSLPEAANFGKNKQALTNTINQSAGAQTDRAAGELKTVTDAAPNAAAVPPRPGVELAPETVGAPPADLEAERAVPPERPESHVEGMIAANQSEVGAKVDDLGFANPEEALANANDPTFTAGLEAKRAFDADAETAPATFREGETTLRTGAMSDAGALGKEQLGAMVATRTNVIGQVATKQRGGKSSSEQKRADVITNVNAIFTKTSSAVKTTLGNLRTEVNETFQTESQKALDTFTSRVEGAERRWNDKTFLEQTAEKVGSIFGIPTELEADLQAIRNAFIEEMKRIVQSIAATVERELATAKQQIADGRAELKEFLDGLDPSLGVLRDELSAEFNGKFGSLESEVRNTEKGLVTELAEKFKSRLEESDKLIGEVRERNRNLVDVFVDVAVDIKESITGMIEKLQQVFADGLATLMEVLANPVQFAKNFLAGIMQGFSNFAANIGTHLKTGLIEWLTGSLAGAGITLPETFDLKGIVGFILQLLGLTVENVKARARVIWGEKIVRAIELGVEGVKKAVELFQILQTEGVAGLFNFLKEKFVEFKDIALQKIKDAITLELVEAAVRKVATLLVPGGAILQAVLSIIDAVFFFIRNADKIAALIQTITGAVKDILAGNVGALAAKVESVLAATIPVVLDFLASLIGIGGKITETIQKALKAVTQPIQDAIDAILLAIKNAIGGFIDKILGRGGEKTDAKKADEEIAPGTPMSEQQIIDAVVPLLSQPTVATDPAEALEEKKKQAEELKKKFQPSAPEGKTLKITFSDKSADDVEEDHKIVMMVGFSPDETATSVVPVGDCDDGALTPGGTRDHQSARLTPEFIKKGTEPGSNPIGWYPSAFALDNLNRGHVIGKQLGGRGTKANLVAMPRSLNEKMIPFESKVRKAVEDGREVQYSVTILRGSDVPFTHPMAVEAARSAGWPGPEDIPEFAGVTRTEDQVAVQAEMNAEVLKDCVAGLPPATLGAATAGATGVNVAARRRATVTVEFDFG